MANRRDGEPEGERNRGTADRRERIREGGKEYSGRAEAFQFGERGWNAELAGAVNSITAT
jgi:hypothetical protein